MLKPRKISDLRLKYPCVFESYMVIIQRNVLSGPYNKRRAVHQGWLNKKTLLEIDMNKV